MELLEGKKIYNFYTSKGDFSLCRLPLDERYCLIKRERKSSTELMFKPKMASEIELEILLRGVPLSQSIEVIRFPIDLAENSFLHIEKPKNIVYTHY